MIINGFWTADKLPSNALFRVSNKTNLIADSKCLFDHGQNKDRTKFIATRIRWRLLIIGQLAILKEAQGLALKEKRTVYGVQIARQQALGIKSYFIIE